MTEEVYNRDERAEMIKRMRQASNEFYARATAIGNHPFIEFCGLMNEYIVLCERAHAEGIDFTQANIHTGGKLPLAPHNVAYLGEKLGCIYGPSLDEANRKLLLESIGT